MALIATVSKTSVTKVQDKRWIISWNMTLVDGGEEVVNKNYPIEYIPGDDIEEKEVVITSMMQADINKYKGEQVIHNSAAMDTAVENVQAALVV